MVLAIGQISVIKGMLLRGDKQHDVAAYFGVNGARIAEIATGHTAPEVRAATSSQLPPPGPYIMVPSSMAEEIENLYAALEDVIVRLRQHKNLMDSE